MTWKRLYNIESYATGRSFIHYLIMILVFYVLISHFPSWRFFLFTKFETILEENVSVVISSYYEEKSTLFFNFHFELTHIY